MGKRSCLSAATREWIAEGRPAQGEGMSRLVGREVRVMLEGDPSYGVTLRWGTLRAVTADGLVIDGYHDCAGIYGRYPDHQADGVTVGWGELLELAEYQRGA
jgi:hypothetical protein